MPRLTADQWAAVRLDWEGEPSATFCQLAIKHNVNKSEISRAAKKQAWVKTGQLAGINESAQRKADSYTTPDGIVTQQNPNTVLASRDEAIDVRAAIVARHRGEIAELEGFRRTALKAMKDAHERGDKESWNIAKIAADTARANIAALDLKQMTERRAWGMDAKAEEDIIITNPRRHE